MEGLKVLIANLSLSTRSGTELYVCDLARRLVECGHRPVIYSTLLGPLAGEIRRETVAVVDDLNKISSPPDIIHGHHANETVTALLRFPGVPAVYFCHDWYFKRDYPPAFPRVLRYVAVDQPCYDKLVFEHGVPEERVRLLCQFVDLERFRPRPPLPPRPRRALVLCNVTEENAYLSAMRAACARSGLALDVFGLGVGRPCARPESILGDYDIVFAKGRAALEALAVGAAVVVYWWRRLGPVVSAGELERLRRENFGVRAMGPQLTPEEFGREVESAVARYDPAEAAEVSRRVRAAAGRDRAVDEILDLYREVLDEHRSAAPADPDAEARAAAAHLRKISMASDEICEVPIDSTTIRLRQRVLRTPVLGNLARAFARAAAGRPPRKV